MCHANGVPCADTLYVSARYDLNHSLMESCQLIVLAYSSVVVVVDIVVAFVVVVVVAVVAVDAVVVVVDVPVVVVDVLVVVVDVDAAVVVAVDGGHHPRPSDGRRRVQLPQNYCCC